MILVSCRDEIYSTDMTVAVESLRPLFSAEHLFFPLFMAFCA